MLHSSVAVLLVGLAVLYVVLCPRLNYAFYRPLLFHPVEFVDDEDSRAPRLAGVAGEDVTFKSAAGVTLHAWYYRRPQSLFTVLFSHGNGGNIGFREDTVKLLLKAGASVFIYDYRGFGKSKGMPDVEGICQDAVAAYDFLNRTIGVSDDRIILYGESLGCAVSTYLSTQRRCSGIVLQSGFASLNRIATEIFPALVLYPGPLLSDPPLDSLSILRRPHPPLFIVHGRADQVVPFDHGAALYQAASEPKRFLELPASGHNDICTTALPEYSRAISQFLLWVAAKQGLQQMPSPIVRGGGSTSQPTN